MATVFDSLRTPLPVQLREEGAQKILFGRVPPIDALCCIIASYEETDKPNPSIYSFFQWTALKCRKLIFEFPDLIATPELGDLRTIYIIVSKSIISENKIQPLLKEHGLNFDKPTYVLKNWYESCIQYTITARISPLWNLIDHYFVQGRDFIMSTHPLNAVRVEVAVFGDQLQVVMFPLRVSFTPFVFNGFHLTESAEDPENQVLNIEEYNVRVYVLPSMKVAYASFLQTKLPENSPFKNYNEIRRYWKNIYGYRLPEYEKDHKVVYATVKFTRTQPGLTYPICCLHLSELFTFKPRNESGILMSFLSDLAARIPNICGFPFASNAYLGVSINKFVNPSFSENSNLEASYPLENLTQLHPIFLSNNINNNHTNSKAKTSNENETKKKIPTINWPSITTTSANMYTTSTTVAACSTTPNATMITVGTSTNIPVKTYCHENHSSSSKVSTSVSHNNIHCYPQHGSEQSRAGYSDINRKKTNEQFRKPTTMFHPYSSNSINSVENSSRSKYTPVFYPRPRPTIKATATAVTSPYFNKHRSPKLNESISVSHYSQQISSKSPYVNNHSLQHNNLSVKESTTSITMSSLLKRENCSLNTYESGVKKRSRPQVQTDVDVSAMARSSEGLTRVNTTTLIAYLRSQGIPCKVKDKKGDLVAKVMAHVKNKN